MTATARVIHSDPDILGGTPVFVGTRVPVKTLLDYLEEGDPLDEFLDHFPGVRREQAIAALECCVGISNRRQYRIKLIDMLSIKQIPEK